MTDNHLILFHQYRKEIDTLFPSSTEEVYPKLIYIIHTADEYYYKYDNPLLSDYEYDQYFSQLKSIESQHPEWVTPASPTQRIYNAKRQELSPVKHLVPMLSLANSYNEDDLREWHKRNVEALGHADFTYTIEPKYDGAGISCVYHDNILHIAATRGDGVVGEDITVNSVAIRSLPLTLNSQETLQFEVRGEVIIEKNDFNLINEKRQNEGLNLFANPRNAASGSLRMLDPQEAKKRKLQAIMYHISYVQADKEFDWQQSHYQMLLQLDHWGFNTPLKDVRLCHSIEEVIAYSHEMESKRDTLPFEIDGMVVKVNEVLYQDQLGQTSHHPRWAMAIKFKARQATSQLIQVDFQVGRTGTITPVAKINPVALGGVTISSISLFNEENILQKDIKINDTVLIERAGDVIPYIVKSIPELRPAHAQDIVFPQSCPVCQHSLYRPEGEAAWRCININCSAQVIERIKHFVSKDAMDIRSLGESNVKRFYELGFLNSIKDIYNLPFEKIAQLEKFGAKSIDNLQKAIEQSKQQSLHRIIFALGIRYVGETTAKTLERQIKDSIFEMTTWDIDMMMQLEDVGPKVAQSVYAFFQDPTNIHLLQELENAGVNLKKQNPDTLGLTFSEQFIDKTFLVTGTLSQYKRSEIEALIESKGGKILSGVSSKLNYLIVGQDAGSKLEKAKKLGTVKILSEAEFVEML